MNAKTAMEEIWNSNLGISLEQQNDFLGSLAARHRAVLLNPDDPISQYNLAFSYDDLCYFSVAIRHYKRAIELDSGFIEAYNNAGNVYKEMGKRDLAVKMYLKALELAPGYPQTVNSLAVMSLKV